MGGIAYGPFGSAEPRGDFYVPMYVMSGWQKEWQKEESTKKV